MVDLTKFDRSAPKTIVNHLPTPSSSTSPVAKTSPIKPKAIQLPDPKDVIAIDSSSSGSSVVLLSHPLLKPLTKNHSTSLPTHEKRRRNSSDNEAELIQNHLSPSKKIKVSASVIQTAGVRSLTKVVTNSSSFENPIVIGSSSVVIPKRSSPVKQVNSLETAIEVDKVYSANATSPTELKVKTPHQSPTRPVESIQLSAQSIRSPVQNFGSLKQSLKSPAQSFKPAEESINTRLEVTTEGQIAVSDPKILNLSTPKMQSTITSPARQTLPSPTSRTPLASSSKSVTPSSPLTSVASLAMFSNLREFEVVVPTFDREVFDRRCLQGKGKATARRSNNIAHTPYKHSAPDSTPFNPSATNKTRIADSDGSLSTLTPSGSEDGNDRTLGATKLMDLPALTPPPSEDEVLATIPKKSAKAAEDFKQRPGETAVEFAMRRLAEKRKANGIIFAPVIDHTPAVTTTVDDIDLPNDLDSLIGGNGTPTNFVRRSTRAVQAPKPVYMGGKSTLGATEVSNSVLTGKGEFSLNKLLKDSKSNRPTITRDQADALLPDEVSLTDGLGIYADVAP